MNTTITITIEQAKTAAEALGWMQEDIESFHLDGCEYQDDPKAAAAELEATQRRYADTEATIRALITAAETTKALTAGAEK